MVEPLDAHLARHARCHHGVFTRSYARSLGFSDEQIKGRIEAGRWLAPTPEALVIAGAPRSFEQDLLVATLSIPGAVASHESAAQLWSMIGVPRDRLVVTIPRHGNHRNRLATVSESTDLKRRDIVAVKGIPTTSRERTLCDLGRVLSVERLRRTVHRELRRGKVTLPGLYAVFYRYARRGRRGITKVRTVLEQQGPGFAVPESELEERTLELFDARGVPRPQGQVELTFWDAQIGRVDFLWATERVIVEVDGWLYHGPDTHESDRERDNAAILAGYRPIRFTWRMVTQRPDYVVDAVLEALRQGRQPAAS